MIKKKNSISNTQLQHDNNALDQSTLSTITAATNIGGDICVLVAGSGCKSVADEAASVAGVSKVLAGAAFNPNTALTSNASGEAVAAANPGDSICGFALEASGGAGELVSMRVSAAGAKVP